MKGALPFTIFLFFRNHSGVLIDPLIATLRFLARDITAELFLSFSASNYSGMLIGLLIAILYFLTRKITAEGAEERRVVNRLFILRAPLRTLRLNSLFGSGNACLSGMASIESF
jgi:hypothetical protein